MTQPSEIASSPKEVLRRFLGPVAGYSELGAKLDTLMESRVQIIPPGESTESIAAAYRQTWIKERNDSLLPIDKALKQLFLSVADDAHLSMDLTDIAEAAASRYGTDDRLNRTLSLLLRLISRRTTAPETERRQWSKAIDTAALLADAMIVRQVSTITEGWSRTPREILRHMECLRRWAVSASPSYQHLWNVVAIVTLACDRGKFLLPDGDSLAFMRLINETFVSVQGVHGSTAAAGSAYLTLAANREEDGRKLLGLIGPLFTQIGQLEEAKKKSAQTAEILTSQYSALESDLDDAKKQCQVLKEQLDDVINELESARGEHARTQTAATHYVVERDRSFERSWNEMDSEINAAVELLEILERRAPQADAEFYKAVIQHVQRAKERLDGFKPGGEL